MHNGIVGCTEILIVLKCNARKKNLFGWNKLITNANMQYLSMVPVIDLGGPSGIHKKASSLSVT